MISRALHFLGGLLLGLVYLIAGGKFIAWNASYSYGKSLVEWALRAKQAGEAWWTLIYLHDVTVFLVLALVIAFAAAFLVTKPQRSVFAIGMLCGTIVPTWRLLFAAVSISSITQVVIVCLPAVAFAIALRLTRRRNADAA